MLSVTECNLAAPGNIFPILNLRRQIISPCISSTATITLHSILCTAYFWTSVRKQI